jgi:6-phosphofructokinase 2
MIYTVTLNPALDRTLYVETLETEQPNRIAREARYAGGKGIDVSRALLEMEVPSIALGFVGGFDGKELEGRLMNDGIACDFTRIAGGTRTNIVIHEETTGKETALLARGPEVQPSELMDFMDKVERITDMAFLVVSGSLPLGLTSEVYRRLMQIGNTKGATTVLDTSGPPLRSGILARPAVIKPNLEELSELAGTRLADVPAIVRFCRTLQDRVRTVLVSLGAEGMILVDPEQTLHARPPTVDVQSTVGAGDCAVAGFVKGLVNKESPQDCLCRAVAAGTAATLTAGTGLCHCKDIDRLLHQVVVEPIAV